VVARALLTGTGLTVLPGFDAAAVEAAARAGCTLTSLVPTALARIDASLFRSVLVGGSSAPASLPANTRWVFDHPFNLILNLAVGGNFVGNPDASTILPQTLLVDYVRVYQVTP